MIKAAIEFAFRLPDIKPQQRLILLTLAYLMKDDRNRVVASYEKIAARSGLGESTVKKDVRALVLKGYLTHERAMQKGGANLYSFSDLDVTKGDSSSAVMDRFDEFWEAYPKKQAKARACKRWMQMKPTQEELEKMLKHLDRQCRSEWTRDNFQFIPMGDTYLNGRRWEDEPAPTNGLEKGGANEHLRYL